MINEIGTLLIHNMNMPKCCEQCRFCEPCSDNFNTLYYCSAKEPTVYMKGFIIEKERHKECPLEETKHKKENE